MKAQILLPLDGSPVSEQILPLALKLAGGLDGKLQLLHIVDTLGLPVVLDGKGGPHLDELIRRERDQATAYLSSMATHIRGEGIDVAAAVVLGVPAQEIISQAEAFGVDLIAMSTHGRSGLSRWALGSVADKVLRSAPVPVLVYHPKLGGGPVTPETIVLPLDGTAEAEAALPVAIGIAEDLHLALVIVRVVPVYSFAFTDGPHASVELLEAMSDEAESYLRSTLHRLQEGGLRARYELVLGDPATGLLELAARTPGPLVVMSTHGRSGLTRAVLGSVTDRVVRSGPAPVIVVHPGATRASLYWRRAHRTPA